MINKKLSAKKLLAVILFFSIGYSGRLFAQSESYIQTITGIISPDMICKVSDEKFADRQLWATIKDNSKVLNLVTFEVRLDTTVDFINKPFGCEVIADIDYKDSNDVERTIPNVKLSLQYDTARGKSYKGVAYYKFDGGHAVTVTVKSIRSNEIDVTKAAFFRIKNQILIERSYKKREGNNTASILTKTFSGNKNISNTEFNINSAHGNADADGRQLDISWDPLDFEYDKFDLEYTFYDAKSQLAIQNLSTGNFDQAKLEEAFKNNATRVSVDAPSYLINLVYPSGYLMVRIRAYTYNLVDGEWDREEGVWHYIGDASGINGFAVFHVNEHETIDGTNHFFLNWQYSAAFAEEGKRKEIVSYFDGGSKSRQSVTISNSDNNTIVAESVLDKQNRPAVSILPVPVDDNTLHYFPAFNKNGAGEVYSYADFNPSNTCASNAMPMNPNFGSSKYYSPNNTWVNEAVTRDVPDAGGYPFAVTEFTNDQTGRIRRQGGVGQKFQIGNGHETSYYYGKPAQQELDRLFGSEAGAAAHYAKNMVVDANGQVSVSYVDIAGKTVATALAGKTPDNLKALPSQGTAEKSITDELIRPQAIVRDASGLKLSFNTTVMVPVAADYDFKYEFSGRSLELLFGFNPAKQVCADCYYDVKFSISDECNQPVSLTYAGGTYSEILVPATFNYGNNPPNPNTSCAEVPPSQTGNIKAVFPKAGEYKVSYQLIMSRKALDFYMEYIKQAQVTKTKDEYKKEYIKKIDLSGCFSDCKDCIQKLGSQAEFIERIKKILIEVDNITVTTDDLEWIIRLYNATLAKCSEAVAKNCTITDGCAEYRKMMLKDVTPGGQYMLYDEGTLLFKERQQIPVGGGTEYINVFLKAKNDNSSTAPEVIINGERKYLRELQESELISNWDPEWAYLLLQYHPEYCLLQECEQQSASKNRDKQMLQTDDDVEAANKFGWNANDYNGFLTAETNVLNSQPPPQQYDASCIMSHITAKVNSFISNVPVKQWDANGVPEIVTRNVSLKEYIKYTVYCPEADKAKQDPVTSQLPFINLAGIPQNITCPEPLKEWRIFRNLYIALKQAAYREPSCKQNNTCGNCFIGVNAFSSMYNPKADPMYYPQLKDFVIEKDAAGTGLQVRYNNESPVNNRCDVYISKASRVNDVVTEVPVLKAEYQENGNKVFTIPGATADDINVYFVEHIINNYNHNIDGTNPPSNCPIRSDFSFSEQNSGHQHFVEYVGKYPLLNKVHFELHYHRSATIGTCQSLLVPVNFDPLEAGKKMVVNGGCDRSGPDWDQSLEQYCISTPASCISDPRWPSYFQKTRRFYESSTADDINTVLQGGNGGSAIGGSSNGLDPQKNAEDLSQGWMQKLSGCKNPSDPNDAARRELLRLRLIEVCKAGTDLMHPFGASTVKDDVLVVVPTSYGDYSFKDAIVWYLGGPETATCNHFAIDFPLPYSDKTPLNDELVNKLTACGYNLLTRFKNEWLAAGGAGNTLYPNLATYIKKMYDPAFYLTDTQIQELVDSYNSGCPLKRPIRIPGILTRCEDPKIPACLKCDQLYKVQVQFQAAYPQFTNTLPNYYELLAGYINEVYQMNVAPTAVYNAIETCKKKGIFDDGCTNKCSHVIAALQKFYQLMPVDEYYTKMNCQQLNCEDVQAVFRQHITTWLNLNLGWNQTYQYYSQHYFTGCAAAYYQEPVCTAPKNPGAALFNPCYCPSDNISCCDDYPPFTLFRTLYPNPVDPRIMAFFFELRNYAHCKPGNLPNISYTQPFAVLKNYFDNLVPAVIPYCSPAAVVANDGNNKPVLPSALRANKLPAVKQQLRNNNRSGAQPLVSDCIHTGHVWHDVNGMNDGYVNNSGANTTPPAAGIPSGLYAYLITPAPFGGPAGFTIQAATAVNSSTGEFSMTTQFNIVPIVIITTAVYQPGDFFAALPPATLPAGWVHTGQQFGVQAGDDGTNDGMIETGDGNCPYTNLNFGIKSDAVNTACSSLWDFTYDSTVNICTRIYDDVFNAGDFVLCSSPLTPIYQSDPDDCIKSTVKASLENAEHAYSEYIKEFMRDYREAYFAKCLSITPSLEMKGKQEEYHYTLYYYDQSGNLVKTIPPKGVNFLTDTEVDEANRLRTEDNGDCYESSTAPIFANTSIHNVTVPSGFHPLQGAGPLTVEGWFKFDNTSTKQVIINQFKDAGLPDPSHPDDPAGKAGYYAYIEGGKLYFGIYGSSRETWVKKQVDWLYPGLLPNVRAHSYNTIATIPDRVRQFKAICNTENSITAISGTNKEFYHLVFQYSGDPNDPHPVKIFVNGVLQPLNWTDAGNGASNAFTDGLLNVPSAVVPTIDEIKYEQQTVQSAFTTAPAGTDLVLGALSRTVNGQTMQGVSGRIKHLRIYHTAPDAADLRRNCFDDCFIPSTKEGLVLWLPLNKQTAANTTEDIQSGGAVPITANWDNPAQPQYPHHNLPTYYAYNSLNQVVHQETPDAGQSNFWYDRLGRLVVSQNAEQKTATNSQYSNRYSYTKYDVLGRITEVGEKIQGTDISTIDTKDDAALNAWLNQGTDRQVTQTVYDAPDANITTDPQILSEQQHHFNSRKRVVTSIYREVKGQPGDYNYASHYIYDVSGNVKRLYQENRKLPNGQMVYTTKTLDYDFDLISGKVNNVWYQKQKQDQYLYRYYYDADNKIVNAQSGRDELTLRYDASYKYYKHGPLGRVELGHASQAVQGIDYAYTLQGWLKGINGLFLNERNVSTGFDMGNDGVAGGLYASIPADVYGYTLGYYDGDYTPINSRGGQHPVTVKQFGFNNPAGPGNAGNTGNQLYNGNIAYTTYANRVLGTQLKPNSYSYQYDQLNRLLKMRSHTPFALNDNWSFASTQTQGDYAEDVSYDANGNILSYTRNGTSKQQVAMDALVYHYKDGLNNNKLDYVEDGVSAGNYTEDIDNQAAGNYDYDKIGNLIKDQGTSTTEQIDDIQWTVYGKIRSITKPGSLIEYGYDPSGNRISKTVTKGTEKNTTYYFRDATGNVMAVYEQKEAQQWNWAEQHLYGSSRLGMWNANIVMDGNIPSPYDQTSIGSRHYELTNHLGNVMATISDRKLLAQPNDGCLPGTGVDHLNIYTRGNELTYVARVEIDFWPDFTSKDPDNFTAYIDPNLPPCEPLPPAGSYYIADVITANDYYPFGMQMPGRKFTAGTEYRYGFNGKENDEDISEGGQDYGMRIYDSRLGRWLSVDPLQLKHSAETPYLYTGGNPVYFVDPDGQDRIENNIYKTKDGKIISRVTVQKTSDSWDIVSIRRESSSSVMGGGSSLVVQYDWYNIGYDVVHIVDENGKEISATKGNDYAFGNKLTTTDGDNVFGDGSWYAGIKVSLGKNTEYEGVGLYAENGQGEETRIGKYTKDMAEVSGLLKAAKSGGEVANFEAVLEEIYHRTENVLDPALEKILKKWKLLKDENRKNGKPIGAVCNKPECQGDTFPLNQVPLHTGKIDTLYEQAPPKEEPKKQNKTYQPEKKKSSKSK